MALSEAMLGESLGGERAKPVPPLPLVGIATSALVASVLAILSGLMAVGVLGKVDADLYLPGYMAVTIIAIVVNVMPLAIVWRRASGSRSQWKLGQYVEAREEVARARDLAVTVIGLSIILILAYLALIFLFTNDAAVQRTFFDPDIIKLSFVNITKALTINILIAICSMVLAIIVGLLLAIMRLLPGRSMRAPRFVAICIIDTFRSLPAVVVIYLVCFGIPLTRIPVLSSQDPILYAIIALTLVYAAYLAELFRSGIESIHSSQYSAALSLGLSIGVVYRVVIIPQMVRNIAPPLLGNFIGLQKDTALVNVVGIIDAFSQSKIYSSNYYNLSSVSVVCLLFIILTIPQTRFVDYLIAQSDSKKSR